MSSSGLNIGVVVIGDQAVRARVEEQLASGVAQLVIGSVDADQGVATAVGRVPDVVVITDPTGGVPVAEIAHPIGAALPATRILVVTVGGPSSDPDALIDSWVAGVVDLDQQGSVVDAIEQVFLGEAVVGPDVATAILDRYRQGSVGALTATEEEVLTRLAAGDAVDAIASEYAVSPRLVRLHTGGALARLHPRA